MVPHPESSRGRRPKGVTVLAATLLLWGALLAAPGFAAGIAMVSSGNVLGGLLSILTPQAAIVAGIGLFLMQTWAAQLTVVVLLYFGFRGFQDAFVAFSPQSAVRAVLVIGILAVAIWYLTRESVKRAFREHWEDTHPHHPHP